MLGVMMDVPKPDAVRTARTVPVTIKGQEDAVRKAKSVVEAISKGMDLLIVALVSPRRELVVFLWCRPSGRAAAAVTAARR